MKSPIRNGPSTPGFGASGSTREWPRPPDQPEFILIWSPPPSARWAEPAGVGSLSAVRSILRKAGTATIGEEIRAASWYPEFAFFVPIRGTQADFGSLNSHSAA